MEFTESLKEQLKGALQGANGAVQLTIYMGNEPSSESNEVLDLLKGITTFLSNVSLKEEKTMEGIEHYPTIQISGVGEKSSYTYSGLPSGYEFASLVEAIRTVAANSTDLEEGLVKKIQSITKPLHLEIFVTPTCTYCPPMVMAGFRVSRINPLIRVSVVEATSFRPYARGKGVMGVPKTFINDGAASIDGSVGIEEFVEKLISL